MDLYYNDHQKPVVDKFLDFCRKHGYNRIAGLDTLLHYASFHKELGILAERISDNSTQISLLKDQPKKEVDTKPKTMGMSKHIEKKK